MTAQNDNPAHAYDEWDVPRLAAHISQLEAAIAAINPNHPILDRARN
jgi:hypothetical protein